MSTLSTLGPRCLLARLSPDNRVWALPVACGAMASHLPPEVVTLERKSTQPSTQASTYQSTVRSLRPTVEIISEGYSTRPNLCRHSSKNFSTTSANTAPFVGTQRDSSDKLSDTECVLSDASSSCVSTSW